ncbi:Cob(I)alamin adenosyltransferase [Intoshia linei]|uniref:Cob(I)alamin adenosyltransferase n=1 Tax=Intoshia linei TaxID=1819745 RepID=A0A177AUA2_9BILA|nr:Cob(I)alamin adenosyltransferase [Intoshia linei]
MPNDYIAIAAQEHSLTEKNNLHNDLITIQSRLQDINSHIAFPRKTIIINDQLKEMFEKTKFNPNNIDILEQKIDTYMNHLPPLHNFVLPGGGHCAASLHICRSVCRRVEREMVNFYLNMDVDKSVFRYVNRLSDYFFAAARYATHKNKRIDVIYKPDKNWN